MRRETLAFVLLLTVNTQAARPFRGGAVATAHPRATEAALAMLNRGGGATDAAVAAALVLGVAAPYHSGLGGGGFALVHEARSGITEVIDFREVAPKAATRDMYLREGKVAPGLSTDGALSVAVPGAARGYLELLGRKGRLKPAVVMAPAIQAARKGFWVTPKYRTIAQNRLDCLRADPEASRLFLRPGAQGVMEAPAVGELITQPELARTLEELSRRGPSAFYEGRVASAIESTVKEGGGILTSEDLASYRVRWRQPLEGSYRGHRVATMPPPSAGGLAVVQVLGVLERAGARGPSSREPAVLHTYVEAVRRAYVDRARYLGDPAFVEIPLPKLHSAEHISQMLASIDPSRATPSQKLLPAPLAADAGYTPWTDVLPGAKAERKNTTHVSVIDREGNAVALTTTVNYWFGSCLVARGTGVLLNDEMDDFAAAPMTPNTYGLVTGEANAIAPGKIPLSSMSPTLVFRKDDPKKAMLALGSPGGSTIPTTVIQVISNVLDGQMDVVRAVGAGRIHHQYLPDAILVDKFGLEPATLRALEALGHAVTRTDGWGDAEAVLIDPATGLATAGSDPRNEGFASGQD
ncbi:MAG: gamma-glutamyltransferase [Myxococcales bacterium]|nr:gamma-glutamyltransferase [Myxococcales bacterium]